MQMYCMLSHLALYVSAEDTEIAQQSQQMQNQIDIDFRFADTKVCRYANGTQVNRHTYVYIHTYRGTK